MAKPVSEHIAGFTVTHPVQLAIVQRLIFGPAQSHQALMPDGLSGHAFGYHLRQLVLSGLVEKTGDGYQLSASGRLIADASSFETFKLKVRPVIGVFMEARDNQGQVLAYETKRAPLYGWRTLPFGKIRLGEDYHQTLTRMLALSQLTPSSEPAWSPLSIRYLDKAGQLVCHRIGAKATVNVADQPNLRSTSNGGYSWLFNLSPETAGSQSVTVSLDENSQD